MGLSRLSQQCAATVVSIVAMYGNSVHQAHSLHHVPMNIHSVAQKGYRSSIKSEILTRYTVWATARISLTRSDLKHDHETASSQEQTWLYNNATVIYMQGLMHA